MVGGLQDALTDLLADTVPFLFGTVGHRGIVNAAHFALATQGSTVRQALERHPGYKLVVTGQSLGGGIALVLSMLIGQTHPDLLPTLECHAFAPPPVISLTDEIPDEIWDALTVYVHGRDCVPRLSVRSFSVLDACVRAVDEQPLTLPDRAGQLAGDAVQLPREVLAPTMPPAFEDEAHYPALVVPGRRIYHLIGALQSLRAPLLFFFVCPRVFVSFTVPSSFSFDPIACGGAVEPGSNHLVAVRLLSSWTRALAMRVAMRRV